VHSEGLTAKQTLLVLSCAAITILFLKVCVYLSNSSYRLAVIYFAIAMALSLIFFRNRKLLLSIVILTFLVVNVGLTAVFHPSLLGFLLTGGSVGTLYWIVRWSAAKHPNLGRKDMGKIFEGNLPE
jgi:hypothetical protein